MHCAGNRINADRPLSKISNDRNVWQVQLIVKVESGHSGKLNRQPIQKIATIRLGRLPDRRILGPKQTVEIF